MILFICDIHFGRDDPAVERANEADLLACLRSLEGAAERLYLVGDVFDQFIEHRHYVPKGFVRFQALLAEWTARGVPVHYLVGNHDPWHRDYFEEELGVRVVRAACTETLYGRAVYLRHGDDVAPGRGLFGWLKPWMRHPLPVALYRLLPSDAGYRLARYAGHRFGGEGIDPVTVEALRAHARGVLAGARAALVVMGHSHLAELRAWPEGVYVNPGSWHDGRTFASLDDHRISLHRWNGTGADEVDFLTTPPAPHR